MKRVTSFVHEYLRNNLTANAIICDLTCGNGNDTFFCAKHFQKVYAIDIQAAAIENTKQKVQGLQNVTFILGSHADLDEFKLEKMDAFIFNSGYLPKGDDSIITQKESTQKAIEKAHQLLKEEGLLLFTFYRKHEGGLAEYEAVYPLFKRLAYREISSYHYENDPLSPIVHIFQQGQKSG